MQCDFYRMWILFVLYNLKERKNPLNIPEKSASKFKKIKIRQAIYNLKIRQTFYYQLIP